MNRYRHTNMTKDSNGKRYKSSVSLAKIPQMPSDFFVQTDAGDRLDILAHRYYQDKTLWWVIALANNMGKGTLVCEPGKIIRIPGNPTRFANSSQQNRGY